MKLSDQKRLQILDAAEELFHSFGVEHTSMDQLALQAQVSKRTVYNHFATKEQLFQAILQRMSDKLRQGGEVQFNPALPIAEQLRRIAADEVALLSSEALLRVAKIAIVQMMKQPELAQTMNDNALGCKRYLADFLQQACQANVLTIADTVFASQQFVYQLKSFVFYPALFGLHQASAPELQHIIDETVAMFLARYGNC
ncbi:TetR/AcrR family transcriptional regulator [Rheinheimera aquimaris]|uniref:TetR/AcrR family transcriptional regulator n=1 Tax=Rheinheimera aquimaris TaxID=412437 RepID=A0ABN1EAE0_9GAMM|nr:TetR/AcrR family transcriptional regulator [Rheinheimera aquimaris]MCB5214980.1 TetR/AcrR family transcriptional regulator [Rheinheimera aquimaris]